MVSFGEKQFTVTVAAPCPADDLHGTINEIIDVLQSEDVELRKNRYFLFELLRHMIPAPEQICEKVQC